MADQLSKDQINEFEKAFRLLDKDGSGEITTQELRQALVSVGENPTDEEIENMLKEVDLDENGMINFPEFLAMMANRMDSNQTSEEVVRAAFNVIDSTKNGSVDASELYFIMKSIGEDITEEEIEEMIKEADIDGTGSVSYDEFLQMMKSI